jgi:glycosidase
VTHAYDYVFKAVSTLCHVLAYFTLLQEFSVAARSRYYPRLMIAAVNGGTANQTASFMKRGDCLGAHIATNGALMNVKRGCDARCINDRIADWTKTAANDETLWSNWQLGNVDVSRVTSRMSDSRYVNALNMLLLTLPGTPLVYYGDELGMKDVNLTVNYCNKLDPAIPAELCPLAQRSPMQWNDKKFAGFTNGSNTWLPVSDDYYTINVEAQLAHGAGISPVSIFSSIAKLRNTEASFLWGKFHPGVSGSVFFYVRQAEGFDGFLVAVNVGAVPSTVHFGDALPETVKADLPDEVTVAVPKAIPSTYDVEVPNHS